MGWTGEISWNRKEVAMLRRPTRGATVIGATVIVAAIGLHAAPRQSMTLTPGDCVEIHQLAVRYSA
jgi:hypothetical protein